MTSRGKLLCELARNLNSEGVSENEPNKRCVDSSTTQESKICEDQPQAIPSTSYENNASHPVSKHNFSYLQSDDEYDDNTDDDPTYSPSDNGSEDESLVQPLLKKKKIAIDNQDVVNDIGKSEYVLGKVSPKKTRSKRTDRKLKRNSGLQYVTDKGKIVKGKKMKILTACRAGCKEKLDEEDRKKIFDEYWALQNYNKRAAFVASLMTIEDKASYRPRVNDPDKTKYRTKTYTYHLECNGKRVTVCKGCFMKTLDESDNVIKLVGLKKRSSTSGIVSPDSRGLLPPPQKHSEEKLLEVQTHIKSFPTYESHYTRRENDKLYLPSHLTLTKMYSLYKEAFKSPVSEKIYAREFKKLKLSFKKRKVDTCHACDVYKMKIEVAENENDKRRVTEERNAHHEAADFTYVAKKHDVILSKENPEVKCLIFDLQQCLPTPSLETSVAFYKRSLWTFNFTVHDAATGKSTHYMWHEGISGRGANQIASCLYKHLKSMPTNVKHVIFYSDTCGGQNRNSHVASMFCLAMKEFPNIEVIDHKFMVPGHSHMEVDVDHAVIEKKKKKSSLQIYHPYDWCQLVRTSSSKFTVVEMQQCDFMNFALLLKGPLVLKKKNNSGESFKWFDTQWLKYEKGEFGLVSYKDTLKSESAFKTLSLKRRGNIAIDLQPITNKPTAVSEEKKKDIISLLPLIPTHFHDFYYQLPVLSNVKDIDPDLCELDSDKM